MTNKLSKNRFQRLLAAALLALGLVLSTTVTSLAQPAPKVKNIVLVHGALLDASTWRSVYNNLVAKGYHVTLVQNPLTSLQDDVDAVNKVLAREDGPVILVGHSYAGAVITEAGGNPKVAGLVYVAALAPDAGESAFKQFTSAPADPENPLASPDSAGNIYGDKAKFRAGFAADIPADLVRFMYASQIPINVKALAANLTQAAWKTKPSWGIIPMADKSINPIIERTAYQRAHSKITEVPGASHCVFISHPAIVASVIEDAANHALLLSPAPSRAQSMSHDNALYQYGIAEAFLGGLFRGQLTVREFKRHGNFGIAAPDLVDGEVIMLNGRVFQTKASGLTSEMADSATLPLAFTCFFTPDTSFTIDNIASQADAFARIDNYLTNINAIYAIRLTGVFDTVRTRAFYPVTAEPFPPVASLIASQKVFSFASIGGTLFGLRVPAYWSGINIAGYHFHFLGKGNEAGGHLLNFAAKRVRVEIARIRAVTVALPDDPGINRIPV